MAIRGFIARSEAASSTFCHGRGKGVKSLAIAVADEVAEIPFIASQEWDLVLSDDKVRSRGQERCKGCFSGYKLVE